MHAYGMYLYDGIGGAENRPEALDWLVKAAGHGEVDSQFNAARIYENGTQGVAVNPTEAYKWYLIAAHAGDPEAQAAVERLTPTLPASSRTSARAAAQAFQTGSSEAGPERSARSGMPQ
jgi:localization factor PodJL